MGSGTISGEEPGSEGCLLEKNSRFLNDGDVVELRAYAERDGLRIEFDSVSGRILPVLI
jgi:fumarylacetoacetase